MVCRCLVLSMGKEPGLFSAAGRRECIGAKRAEHRSGATLFRTFWQENARENPAEIARVSAALLSTQHNIGYVEYFSKCLHYSYLYPPFSPGVCRADPRPLSRPRAAASYCPEKFLALPNRFDLGGVISHPPPKIFPYCEKSFYNYS